MNGYISCPQHGDLYKQTNVDANSIIDPTKIEPLQEPLKEVDHPKAGDEMACPLCKNYLIVSLRDE